MAGTSERCTVATELALEAAREECETEEALRRQLARLIGVGDVESDDHDQSCDVVLTESPDQEFFNSPTRVRQWVFCRAWSHVRDEDKSLSEALEQAWSEIDARAAEAGVEV